MGQAMASAGMRVLVVWACGVIELGTRDVNMNKEGIRIIA